MRLPGIDLGPASRAICRDALKAMAAVNGSHPFLVQCRLGFLRLQMLPPSGHRSAEAFEQFVAEEFLNAGIHGRLGTERSLLAVSAVAPAAREADLMKSLAIGHGDIRRCPCANRGPCFRKLFGHTIFSFELFQIAARFLRTALLDCSSLRTCQQARPLPTRSH